MPSKALFEVLIYHVAVSFVRITVQETIWTQGDSGFQIAAKIAEQK